MRKRKCEECDASVKKLFMDYRDPPLVYGKPCLCKECATMSLEDRIEEEEWRANHYRDMLKVFKESADE